MIEEALASPPPHSLHESFLEMALDPVAPGYDLIALELVSLNFISFPGLSLNLPVLGTPAQSASLPLYWLALLAGEPSRPSSC